MLLVKDNKEDILSYLEDASNFREGHAEKVYIPESEPELLQVLSECAEKKMAVTVSGGGTGTVGGRVSRVVVTEARVVSPRALRASAIMVLSPSLRVTLALKLPFSSTVAVMVP